MSAVVALPPGPRSFLSIREMLSIRNDIFGFIDELESYGDIACFRLGTQLCYYVTHPSYIQDVFETHQQSLHKTWIFRRAEDAFGNSILTSAGDEHRRKRKILQPAFHKTRIHQYMNTIIEIADKADAAWQNGAQLDMAAEMQRIMIAVAAQTLFGTDVDEETDEIGDCLLSAMDFFSQIKGPVSYLLSNISLTPRNIRLERATQRMHDIISKIIDKRRNSGVRGDDFLAMLLAAQEEHGSDQITDKEIRDEAISIFLSGFETSTNTMTWAWYLLSQHAEVEEELHQELDAVIWQGLPTPNDLEKLTFTRKVLTEALRMYPSAYIIPRRVMKECQIGEYTMPVGSLVFVGVHSVQHDARFYAEPDVFNPHRWTSETMKQLPRYAFAAFGGGQHSCMGQQFAWSQTMLVLAILAQRWRATVKASHEVKPDPLVNLRPLGGMPMVLQQR